MRKQSCVPSTRRTWPRGEVRYLTPFGFVLTCIPDAPLTCFPSLLTEQAAKAKKAQRIEREENADPIPPAGPGPNDTTAQMQQQEQLMQQMQQQQEHFMGGGAGGVPGGPNPGAMGGVDPMGQMGGDPQALMQQQREAMLAGAGDPSQLGAMGGDPSAAMHQQNMGAGLFGAGQNPYALQAAGLGGGVGFPGGMGAAAFGLNSASAAANPYLANALANQAAYMQAPGQAGSLSALMGKCVCVCVW